MLNRPCRHPARRPCARTAGDAMPVKRRHSKRRVQGAAELDAWSGVFDSGYDFFDELPDIGVETDANNQVPDDVLREAWERLGAAYLETVDGVNGRTGTHALEKFAMPVKKRAAKRQAPKLTSDVIEAWRTMRRLESTRQAHGLRAMCPGAPAGAFVYRCQDCEAYHEANTVVFVGLGLKPWDVDPMDDELLAQLDAAIAE